MPRLAAKCGKEDEQAGKIPAGSFPFQCAYQSAGGAGVPTSTLGKKWDAHSSPSNSFPCHQSQGITHGPRRSETSAIIDAFGCWVDTTFRTLPRAGSFNNDLYRIKRVGTLGRTYFKALAIAASARGAIILYPAALGCRPSSAKSFFSMPFSSTSAEK